MLSAYSGDNYIYLEVKIIGQLMWRRLPPGTYHRWWAEEGTVASAPAIISGHRWSRMEQWLNGAEGEEGVGRKEEAFPLYRGDETLCLPACLMEPARSPLTAIGGTVGLPTPVLKRTPR